MKFNEFLKKCTAMGGNWTGMLLSGIKEVAPEVYDAMPDRSYEFDEVGFIVNHLCYDRPHLRYNISISGQVIEYTIEGKFVFREATEAEMAMTAQEFDERYNGVTPADLEKLKLD